MKASVGVCPFCKEKVRPNIIEENTIFRDVCECPECHGKLLICRVFGCENYAKSGKVYDDELCPCCAKNITLACAAILVTAVTAGAKAWATGVGSNMTKK